MKHRHNRASSGEVVCTGSATPYTPPRQVSTFISASTQEVYLPIHHGLTDQNLRSGVGICKGATFFPHPSIPTPSHSEIFRTQPRETPAIPHIPPKIIARYVPTGLGSKSLAPSHNTVQAQLGTQSTVRTASLHSAQGKVEGQGGRAFYFHILSSTQLLHSESFRNIPSHSFKKPRNSTNSA